MYFVIMFVSIQNVTSCLLGRNLPICIPTEHMDPDESMPSDAYPLKAASILYSRLHRQCKVSSLQKQKLFIHDTKLG
jgi:hypothetical protein